MASTLIGILLSVLIITGKVAAQSFDFTCPKAWTDGAIENMMCVIPRATFNDKTNGGSCDFYYDSVLFKVTLSDQTSSSPCTVTGFDSKCDGSLNTNGCGCREISGGNIVIDYNITAVQADHEGARWECIPQCLDSNGDLTILSPPDRPECANTTFVITTTTTLTTTSAATTAVSACVSFACNTGTCYLDGTRPKCDCSGTKYFGDRCEYPSCTYGQLINKTSTATIDAACDCNHCIKGTHCDEFSWLCLLYILLLVPPVILSIIIIIIFCCPCGNIACLWCHWNGQCYCRCFDKRGGAACWEKEESYITHVCYCCAWKKYKDEKEDFKYCLIQKKDEPKPDYPLAGTADEAHQVTPQPEVSNGRSAQRKNKVADYHVGSNGNK